MLTDAVRKEQRRHAFLNKIGGTAAQNPRSISPCAMSTAAER